MTIYKYQGAGNDFVIIDNRDGNIKLSEAQVKTLCDRRFGIGADGLMMLENSKNYDFSMRYYNADGQESTMCGNGGRCLVAFAAHRGITNFDFEAIDGFHTAQILDYSNRRCMVRLKMIDVPNVEVYDKDKYFLNTGSPHLVIFVKDLESYDVENQGKYWRWHNDFKHGTNVNFVEIKDNKIAVRTYERGVEAETLACGTGVTAASIASYKAGYKCYKCHKDHHILFHIQTLTDRLSVEFSPTFQNVYLTGPASYVFTAEFPFEDR